MIENLVQSDKCVILLSAKNFSTVKIFYNFITCKSTLNRICVEGTCALSGCND